MYRQVMQNELWCSEPFTRGQAWVDLLLQINHSDNKMIFDGNLVEVKRGSLITSIRKLCDRWKWSNTKVVKFLKLLKNCEMIDYFSDAKKTALTVINWDIYQSSNDAETSQKRQQNDTETSQKHTNKNDRECKEDILPNGNTSETSSDKAVKADTVREVIEFYNQHRRNMPEAKTLSKQRAGFIHARIEQYGIDNVRQVIFNAKKSDFLNGAGSKAWKADLNWIMRPENFVNVLEGKYENRTASADTNRFEVQR